MTNDINLIHKIWYCALNSCVAGSMRDSVNDLCMCGRNFQFVPFPVDFFAQIKLLFRSNVLVRYKMHTNTHTRTTTHAYSRTQLHTHSNLSGGAVPLFLLWQEMQAHMLPVSCGRAALTSSQSGLDLHVVMWWVWVKRQVTERAAVVGVCGEFYFVLCAAGDTAFPLNFYFTAKLFRI